ncbi:hypothetical protein ACFUCQ_02250 [Streptomyces sp. NPDC057197]|uniref:hypothetical protein n=1 Tax=Streptomyces sp. NPDC057197 TaxID=3346045 RepID=UPI00362CF136
MLRTTTKALVRSVVRRAGAVRAERVRAARGDGTEGGVPRAVRGRRARAVRREG